MQDQLGLGLGQTLTQTTNTNRSGLFETSTSPVDQLISLLSQNISKYEFTDVPTLEKCAAVVNTEKWNQFIDDSINFNGAVSRRINEILVIKRLSLGASASLGSSSTPTSSQDPLKLLNSEVEKIQSAIKKRQHLLHILIRIWKTEDEGVRQLGDGNAAASKMRAYSLEGLSVQSKTLQAFFEKKQRVFTASNADIYFCQLQKVVYQKSCNLVSTLQATEVKIESEIKDLEAEIKELCAETLKNAIELKEIYEKEAGIHIPSDLLQVDGAEDKFAAWHQHYRDVRSIFRKLSRMQQDIQSLRWIYWYAPLHVGVNADYVRLNAILSKIQAKFDALIQPERLEEKEKFPFAAKAANIEQMKKKISKLLEENKRFLEKLNNETASLAKIETDELFPDLSLPKVRWSHEVERREETVEDSLQFPEVSDIVAARSNTWIKAMKLLSRMAGLREELNTCVLNKHELAECDLKLKKLQQQYEEIELEKTEYLNRLKASIEEAQKRHDSLTTLDKIIRESTVKLSGLVPDFSTPQPQRSLGEDGKPVDGKEKEKEIPIGALASDGSVQEKNP